MILSEMKTGVESRIDDTVLIGDLLRWLNDAKDDMALEINANFPDIVQTGTMDDFFVFDSRYHIGPVLYACARFKEQQQSVGEANNFMQQYLDLRRKFVADYEVPAQYREDRLSQQFTATSGQTDFTITKNGYDPSTGDLKIYVNNIEVEFIPLAGKTFSLVIPTVEGDAVTAVWEEHTDFVDPPYSFWNW
jgi:hypothetical protein